MASNTAAVSETAKAAVPPTRGTRKGPQSACVVAAPSPADLPPSVIAGVYGNFMFALNPDFELKPPPNLKKLQQANPHIVYDMVTGVMRCNVCSLASQSKVIEVSPLPNITYSHRH